MSAFQSPAFSTEAVTWLLALRVKGNSAFALYRGPSSYAASIDSNDSRLKGAGGNADH